MSEMHVLTIDLGTSGPKTTVVSETGAVVGSARGHIETIWSANGGAEQDPEAVWDCTLSSAKEALASSGVAPSSIAAVIVSSQFSSIIPVRADGSTVGNMVLWLDQRGRPGSLKKLAGYPRMGDSPAALLRWLKVHGLPPIDGAMSLNHVRYLKFAEPRVYEAADLMLEPVDFLTMRLCGRATASQCTAFMMLCTDNRTLGATDWADELVSSSMIDRSKLPELVPTGSTVGTVVADVADALGLPSGVPVLSGINDTQAGAIAAGAFEGSHAGLAVGTSSVITTHLPKKKTDPITSLFTIPSPIGGCHLVSGENGMGGVAVDYFLDKVVYPDDPFETYAEAEDRYRAFNDAASHALPGSSGVMFLPWLRGAIAPKAEPRMRGGFINIGLDTGRNDMARALFEGVAYNLAWLRGPVEKFVKRDLSHFVFYGGGAQSDLWSQIMADVLGSPIHQLAAPGFANSLGTAMFGFERLGMIDTKEVAKRVEIKAVYEPNAADAAIHAERFGIFKDIFKQTKPLFRKLNSAKA